MTSTTTSSSTTGSTTTSTTEPDWCEGGGEDLRGCWALQQASSGTILDASANGHHGTAEDIELRAGPLGTAIAFSDDSRVEIPDNPALDFTSDFTVEVWAYVDELPHNHRMGIIDNDGQWGVFIYPGPELRWLGGHTLGLEDVVTGQWLHIAIAADDETVAMFVDGVVVDSGELGSMSTSNDEVIALGDVSHQFNQPLAGAIGGLRVWSYRRSDAEICHAAGC